MNRTAKKSGEKGLIIGKKTYDWGWKINVFNHKPHDISILMEDAYPQIRDERIKLVESFPDTQPTKKNNSLTWDFTIPPESEKAVEYGFSITYPDEMDLTFGGR